MHPFGRYLATAGCVAAAVALSPGSLAAGKHLGSPRPPAAEPTFDLSAIVGVPSCANALSELGTVVGVRRTIGSLVRGFSWSKAAGVVDLERDAIPFAVNDRGEMAGQGDVTGSGLQALVWTAAGTMRIAVGVAYDLNNRTEVVGFHLPPVGDPPINHGFRWTEAGGLMDVESLTGETPPWSYFAPLSITRFIRTDGVMAGERGGEAVLWQPGGQLTILGDGVANSVNDLDVVAGANRFSDGQPVIWRDGVQTIITDAVGQATDINAAGYVVGWMLVGGERHGFVWHPQRGLRDLGPGQTLDIDEIGDVAGCRGSGDESAATVWQVKMSAAEYLIGFDARAHRLLADVDAKASRAVFREIDLARQALDRGHGLIAERHLRRAVIEVTELARADALPDEWAAALRRIGAWIAARL